MQNGTNQLQPESFWKSRVGLVLIVFLTIVALLLIYEHRAHIFVGNWLLIALLLACPLMHRFMHGGHSSHGGHSTHGGHRHDRNAPKK
jgi:heme/copper-type cytochrome/quinol oxidase subunit 4